MKRLRIATRKSALALWQARHVRDRLMALNPGLEVDLVPIVTQGDRILDRPLAEIGGKGLFLKELEVALLAGRADLAVHSMKDVPAEMASGLALCVSLPRANPFDAWLQCEDIALADLPAGSRVGTSSLRRQCQVLAARPDLVVAPLRGNVDTRIAKLDAGDYDAIILAAAGLERLGLEHRISAVLGAPHWLPAATQGIIGIECRADDAATRAVLEPLNHPASATRALAERTASQRLEGSCQVPLAVYAELREDALHVSALVGTPDGRTVLRAEVSGSPEKARALGAEVAGRLLADGAAEIIRSLGH